MRVREGRFKRVASLMLATMMAFGVFAPLNVYAGDFVGYGSNGKFLVQVDFPEADSIPISNRGGLESIKNNLDGNYHLTNDIDLSGEEWIPIGTSTDPFTGVFDGQGYVVTGMTISDVSGQHPELLQNNASHIEDFYVGLFGYISNSTVKNVGLENSNILIAHSKDDGNKYERLIVGGLVGYAASSSEILNCYNNGNVSVSFSDDMLGAYGGNINAGGIVGYAFRRGSSSEPLIIADCYNTGDITVRSESNSVNYQAGGIVGGCYMDSQDSYQLLNVINGCYNSGKISATGTGGLSLAGGIAGGHIGDILNSYNLGETTAESMNNSWTGGIVGEIYGYIPGVNRGEVSRCFNAAAVSSATLSNDRRAYSGGIAGDSYDTYLNNCHSAGNISATSTGDYSYSFAGGIAGVYTQNNMSNPIEYCYSAGIVTHTVATGADAMNYSFTTTGGIAGDGDVSNSAVLLESIESNAASINFVSKGNKTNVLAVDDISGGVAMNDATAVHGRSVFENPEIWETLNFDFYTIWSMPEGGGFPVLKWQTDHSENPDGPDRLRVISVESPANAVIGTFYDINTIKADVPMDTKIVPLVLTVTDDTEWKLFSDMDRTIELTDKQIPIPTSAWLAFAYVRLYGLDGAQVDYMVTITLLAAPVLPEIDQFSFDVYSEVKGGAISQTVWWGSNLFYYPSTTYQDSLADVSMSLSAAAYGDVGSDGKKDSDPSYIHNALATLGFSDIESHNYSGYNENGVGFTLASANISNIENGEHKLVAVVIRGTSLEEWYGNFNIGSESDIHVSFKLAEIEVFDALKEYIQRDPAQRYKILVTGHSRGAAVANLLAVDINERKNELLGHSLANDFLPNSDIYCYTFATPNVTTKNEAKNANAYSYIFNIVAIEDFVPYLPLSTWEYWKYGITLVFPWDDSARFNEMERQFESITGKKFEGYGDTLISRRYDPVQKLMSGMRTIAPTLSSFYQANAFGFSTHTVFNDVVGAYLAEDSFSFDFGTSENTQLKTYIGILSFFYANNISAIVNNTEKFSNKVIYSHTPETYMAWMSSTLSGDLRTSNQMPSGLRFRVACPVDVELYDSAGKLVLRINNDEIDENLLAEEIAAYVIDEIKEFYLLSDEQYTLKLSGTGIGEMTFTVEEYNILTFEVVSTKAFSDVELSNGKAMLSIVGGGIDTPDVRLMLADDAGKIIGEIMEDGTEIFLTSYSINAVATTGGSALGGGIYADGSSVTLTATANNNHTFDGWYENNTKIPNAGAIYSFIATENRTLEARFTHTGSSGNSGNNGSGSNVNPGNNSSGSSGNSSSGNGTITDKDSNAQMPDSDDTKPAQNNEDFELPFSDVLPNAWYYDAVKFVYAQKLFVGTSETTFSPNYQMSRGMLVTVLYRLAGEPMVVGSSGFADVDDNAYYATAVAWAREVGIVSGVGGNMFAPDMDITREQLVVMLMNFAKHNNIDIAVDSEIDFVDNADVSTWAVDAVAWAQSIGIISGKPGGIFDPQGTATRAEFASIMHRFFETKLK